MRSSSVPAPSEKADGHLGCPAKLLDSGLERWSRGASVNGLPARPVLLPLLCLALIHGLLYVCVVPPWGHYDETTHFEYAWLIADRLSLPQEGDHDRGMRRKVASSMLEHRFYRDRGSGPTLLEQGGPIWIGFSELPHPPLYYLLLAAPLRLVRHADIVLQLYVARLFSLLLYLLSVWVGYRLVGELVAQNHPLRWAIPGTMALLPAYTDLMTAVNNDVGAVALFTVFLWGAVRLVQRGPSLTRLLWVAGTAALCAWTKNTVSIAIALFPVALALALLRGKEKGWWIAVPVSAAVLAFALLAWGDAASWYRSSVQTSPTSQDVEGAPLGARAIALEIAAEEPGREVFQLLPQQEVEALRGMTVTVGAWVWASRPVEVRTPVLYDGQRESTQVVHADVVPAYHAVTTSISSDAVFVQVILRPSPDTAGQDGIIVYYDGIVLAEGERATGTIPSFDDVRGSSGTWDSRPFANRVRNGSGEATGPYVRSWIERPLRSYTRRSPSQFLASLWDWQRTGWVYRVTAVRLFRSFWATFGWNQVELPPAWYWALALLTAWGVAGATVSLACATKRAQCVPRIRAVIFLAIAALALWGNAYLRPHPVPAHPFLPVARYAYPAIVPTVLALAGGWWTLTPQRMRGWYVWAVLVVLGALDVTALWAVITFFYGR